MQEPMFPANTDLVIAVFIFAIAYVLLYILFDRGE